MLPHVTDGCVSEHTGVVSGYEVGRGDMAEPKLQQYAVR